MMAYPNPSTPRAFWRDALDWKHSITRHLVGRIFAFSAFALLVSLLFLVLPWSPPQISHVQYTGGVLAALLVLRTNAGYERWWEGRKLWGGIVNQSRNLARAPRYLHRGRDGRQPDTFRIQAAHY